MNPCMFPSGEPLIVFDQHFDDAADGTEIVADVSSTSIISTFSASSGEDGGYEYDYDQFQIHTSPSQTTKLDHENLSSLDMVGHDDVLDVKDQRLALGRTKREGDEQDW
eukprot:CAMPEP_0197461108 /NCGR_PEP_ID=MMETSP1175-20131217/55650_1 /TAXON_ID=1003142 /ORGANISM="Triceratium dubium, Strain CCMP147" /LENGTH=108 /DNA_ID=CAMNT_0042996325 /DNA_START=472 /DNA_END=795 /DNA_ORIENTATION=+